MVQISEYRGFFLPPTTHPQSPHHVIGFSCCNDKSHIFLMDFINYIGWWLWVSRWLPLFLFLFNCSYFFHRSRHLWQPEGGRAVFGGQVVGQALAAASFSVPDHHHTHSLHCYFLRPGLCSLWKLKTALSIIPNKCRSASVPRHFCWFVDNRSRPPVSCW